METKTGCFLCEVPLDLMYTESETAIALCGLGPLVPGYTVVGAKAHVASAADVSSQDQGFLDFAESVRSFLARHYGSCLVTEHGRMPACVGPAGEPDTHCFHAHFLMFPGVALASDSARTYFASCQTFPSTREALESALGVAEYFFISPSAGEASILTRPGRLIPQFARMLVANATGHPELANWRKAPLRDQCLSMATQLRALWQAEER
jgi:hypothetical protein